MTKPDECWNDPRHFKKASNSVFITLPAISWSKTFFIFLLLTRRHAAAKYASRSSGFNWLVISCWYTIIEKGCVSLLYCWTSLVHLIKKFPQVFGIVNQLTTITTLTTLTTKISFAIFFHRHHHIAKLYKIMINYTNCERLCNYLTCWDYRSQFDESYGSNAIHQAQTKWK